MAENRMLPVQKCLAGVGVRELSDIELVAAIIGSGTRDLHVFELAARLLSRFDGLSGIYDAGIRELSEISGIGNAKSIRLLSSLEAGRRIVREISRPNLCDSPLSVWKLILSEFSCSRREEFRVLVLDNKNRLIRNTRTSVGTVNEAIVHPREVFRDAIRESGSAVILVHNHPSGILTPSREDIDVTNRIREAGKIIGITLLDHLIVSETGYLSMKEDGFL